MDADGHRNRREIVQFTEELAAVRHGGVVGFVIAEPGVDGCEGAGGAIEIDLNLDGLCWWLRGSQ